MGIGMNRSFHGSVLTVLVMGAAFACLTTQTAFVQADHDDIGLPHGLTIVRPNNVRDIFRSLFGGDGIRLSENSGFGHDAHYTIQTFQGLDNLGQAIAGNVGFLSFNSVVAGFTLNMETGEPVRTTDSLGPLLAENPNTLGKGKLNIGFTYTRVKFDRFEGVDLGNLSLRLDHPDVIGPSIGEGPVGPPDGELAPVSVPFPPFVLDFELDQVLIDLSLRLTQDIYTVFANYGLTDNWDVGIIVPIITVRAKVTAWANIFDPTPETESPHAFDDASDQPVSISNASATGIGDIILRTKYNLIRDEEDKPALAIGGKIVLPTGDEDELLGLGETRLMALLILAKTFGTLTPHANIGYEYVPGESQLDSVRYVLGADLALLPAWTVAVDLLGRWEHSGDDIGDHLVDFTAGTKVEVVENVLLSINLKFPLNKDEGLRADVIWSVGGEVTF